MMDSIDAMSLVLLAFMISTRTAVISTQSLEAWGFRIWMNVLIPFTAMKEI